MRIWKILDAVELLTLAVVLGALAYLMGLSIVEDVNSLLRGGSIVLALFGLVLVHVLIALVAATIGVIIAAVWRVIV